MQRIEEGGLIVSCDFCGTDWNGASAVIEGHRGSIICLDCLKAAVGGLRRDDDAFHCVLCLRDRVPADVPRWNHVNHPGTFVCRDCVLQAADVFDRDAEVDWTWEDRPAR